MFSIRQKQIIAEKVEEFLLSFNHPEMPKEKPSFLLHVDGKEDWSWADIKPNWTYTEEDKPGINPHNEMMDLTSPDKE